MKKLLLFFSFVLIASCLISCAEEIIPDSALPDNPDDPDEIPECSHTASSEKYDYFLSSEDDKLYTQPYCSKCGEKMEPVQVEEGKYVIITPDSPLPTFESDTIYYFAEGEHEIITSGSGLWYRGAENVTFVADKNAEFLNKEITIGYHSGQDGAIEAKENSTLVVKGFNIDGRLIVSSSDKNVIIEDNVCRAITIDTWKTDKMDVTVRYNTFTGNIDLVDKNDLKRFNLYYVPEASDYTLRIKDNTFGNSSSHCISIQGNGQGAAITAALDFEISGNTFQEYGDPNDTKRAVFKIWKDTKWAPSSGNPLSEEAIALMEDIINDNTFNVDIDGTKRVYGNFYDTMYIPE